ncbi:DHA2 family efflux MFS transporter permease subunit [Rhodoluna limnophila]|uniref:DHA2 family efflux MFS transporter permease subunit n=1 Tax=Rhodoluna limnophila TaxID=232537 RepID=UPI0011069657|nr:DHA2 family efflux MFS transporter permease subunit [Rhodoluna limnophila]
MQKTRNRWIGLVFISLAISLVIIDGTIVNTIFPSIIEDLGLTSTEVQWVQESYVLVFASLLLVWGSLADRIGRRKVLVIGLVIFVLASVWAGFSQDAAQMIMARVAQGVGGAMVLPTTLSLVNANFQGRERGIAFAVWGSTIGGMVAVGPVLGGWLATDFDWRWAFNVNLPLGLIVIAGLLFWIRESKQEHREGGIDYVGAAISVVMFATLVFGLIEGRVYGWWQASTANVFTIGDFSWPTEGLSIIPVSLGISLVFFVLFALWEKARERAHKNVLLDLDLFKIGSFRNGSIAALIISMGEFGLLFAIPLWLQNVLGLSAISSGLVLLWLAGGSFLASGIGGAMSGKLSATNAVRIGVALELIGIAGIALFGTIEGGWLSVAAWLMIYGMGIGLATAQLTGVIMVDVPNEKIGQASGSQSTVRQIGSALGIAVLGTILFTSTQVASEQNLREVPLIASIDAAAQTELVEGLTNQVVDSAGAALPYVEAGMIQAGLPPQAAADIQAAANQGFTTGVQATGWAAAGFMALGFASTFAMGTKRRKESTETKS